MILSIIIVNFNTKDKLRMCLARVFSSATNFAFEIFVVDNASVDGSAAMVKTEFPPVKLIANDKNSGYSFANNQAIRKSAGKYVLLLNPDVEVSVDTFDKMISFMDNNLSVGISGCKVLKPDGTLDLACRRSFPNLPGALFRFTGLSFLFPKSKLASYNLTYLPEDEIAEVDSVVGAFLLIGRKTIDRIGLLDETYFMYGEDMDWCYRAKQAGFQVMYVPITTVIHHKGSSSRKSPAKSLYEFHRAMQIFYDKFYRQKHNFLVNSLVSVGIWSRYAIKLFQNFFRKQKYVSK